MNKINAIGIAFLCVLGTLWLVILGLVFTVIGAVVGFCFHGREALDDFGKGMRALWGIVGRAWRGEPRIMEEVP